MTKFASRALTRFMTGAAMSTLALGASPAFAQTVANEANEGEILVLGVTKQAENIQDVPTTVTAFDAVKLDQQGLKDIASVANFTPGVNIRGGGNNPTALNVSIRGQIQNDTLATLEPSVGIYLDELYIARNYGISGEMVDMKSVQVLKGPQGTLFGRNTSAGAVVMQTADPEFGAVSGTLRATYGRFDERSGSGVINLPLGENVAVRGALFYAKRGNYQRDVNTGKGYGKRDMIDGRIKLSANLAEGLNLLLSGEWTDSDIKGPAFQNTLFYLPGVGDVAAGDRAKYKNEDSVSITPATVFTGAPKADLFNSMKTQTYMAKLKLETGFGEIKLINGYRHIKGNNLIDLDGSSFPGHFTQGIQNLKQYSSELQATGKAFGDMVDFAAGLTYMRETGTDDSRSATVQNTAIWSGFSGGLDNNSYGIYAQANVHASDKLSVVIGGRYSKDKKGVIAQSAVFPGNGTVPAVCLPQTYQIAKVLAGTLTAADCNRNRSDTWNNFSYTVGLNYQVSDDVMVYAKQSRGYRAGAQQARTLTLTDTTPANPEIVNEQEIGIKSQFADRRVTLNLAGFHNKVRDAQRSVILNIGGVNQTILENAGTETWGFETDFNVKVTDGLDLFGSFSVIDPKYTSYNGFTSVAGVLTAVDKSGDNLVSVVKKTFAVGGNYSGDLGFARLNLNASYSWRGKSFQNGERGPGFIANGVPAALVPAYLKAVTSKAIGVTNVRAALAFGPEDNYEIALWGRNIFNERTAIYALYLGGLNYVGTMWNDPATYGVTATLKF